MLLTLLGFGMVITFMTLIMTKRLSPLVALILVPIIFALLGGFGAGIDKMMLDGIRKIAPTGVTTDSYELFQRRCQAAHRKTQRIKSSIKRTSKRIARAKKHDASTHKIVKLKIKLREKRAKAKPAKKAEKFACSIPQ